MDVLIVGAGTMGQWFADAVDGEVAFADVNEAVAQSAADAVDGRVVPLAVDDAAETFDVVCIAVPMAHVEAAIETQAPRAERALVDVAGVMEPAVEAMATTAPKLERLSLHPLFAPDRAPGSIAVVRDEPGSVTDGILETLAARGNDLVDTTAEEHDAAMESIQAAAHASVLAFALAAERVPEEFETPIYAELRALVERITDGTPRVYADIQRTFDGATAVADAAERVATADDEAIEALIRDVADQWAEPSAPGPSTESGGDHDGPA